MHPHPNENHSNFYETDHFTLFTIVSMVIICWAAVILFMVIPWCIGQRQKMAKFITNAFDKKKLIGYFYVVAWAIVAIAGWFTLYLIFWK